jgi:16S rRNA (cytidine1402-2'-O)-methyltransferase
VTGTLYIVSTPIGNLEDITLRALRILKEVDIIAAEDTRHSLKLLTHYGISKPMISYWGAKEKIKADEVIRKLRSGQSVALVSDAGTPGISDPGAVIIRKVIEEQIPLTVIPGPSSFVAALSLSGLSSDEFTFIGFLPSNKTQRLKALKDLCLETRTLIFYEAPHRVAETLMDMEKIFPERRAALIKEITKMHEEVLRGIIPEVRSMLEHKKISGEYIIIVEGRRSEKHIATEDALLEVHSLMKKGLSRKEAVRRIAEQYRISKKELYNNSLHYTT